MPTIKSVPLSKNTGTIVVLCLLAASAAMFWMPATESAAGDLPRGSAVAPGEEVPAVD